MRHFWHRATVRTLVASLLCCSAAPAQADQQFDQMLQDAMKLYESHDNEDSAAKFEEAMQLSTPGTENEYKAAKDMLLPLSELGDKDRLWYAKKRVCDLDHRLHGAAIPDEFAADAPPGAKSTNTTSASTPVAAATPPGYDEAVKLLSSGKTAAGAAKLEAIVKSGKADANTHLYLGGAYQSLKKYKPALVEYDWVAKNATLQSIQRKGKDSAQRLRNAMAGICPGDCLKMSTPGWAHYPGMDPSLLWMKFPYNGGYKAWSTHHLGQVVRYVNGVPENLGNCPICGGTGEVPPLK